MVAVTAAGTPMVTSAVAGLANSRPPVVTPKLTANVRVSVPERPRLWIGIGTDSLAALGGKATVRATRS